MMRSQNVKTYIGNVSNVIIKMELKIKLGVRDANKTHLKVLSLRILNRLNQRFNLTAGFAYTVKMKTLAYLILTNARSVKG